MNNCIHCSMSTCGARHDIVFLPDAISATKSSRCPSRKSHAKLLSAGRATAGALLTLSILRGDLCRSKRFLIVSSKIRLLWIGRRISYCSKSPLSLFTTKVTSPARYHSDSAANEPKSHCAALTKSEGSIVEHLQHLSKPKTHSGNAEQNV